MGRDIAPAPAAEPRPSDEQEFGLSTLPVGQFRCSSALAADAARSMCLRRGR
jgi:hypothetical protein